MLLELNNFEYESRFPQWAKDLVLLTKRGLSKMRAQIGL